MMAQRTGINKELHKNNSGFSLVELIVVIGIMAVLLTTVLFSISMIFSAGAKGCADALENAIADTKINAMGRAGAYLEIKRSDDGHILVTQYIRKDEWMEYNETKSIADKNIYLSTSPAKVSMAENLQPGESYYVAFDRSSGAFVDSVKDKEGLTRTCVTDQLYIKGGNRYYELTFYGLTGKTDITELE